MNFNFTPPITKGRKPDLFMVLDCETATLPFANGLVEQATSHITEIETKKAIASKMKQNISIAKPLIYDLGWQIVDRKGNIYSQHSILIQETFFVPSIFNTAYYKEKRPMYMERLDKGELVIMGWQQAMELLESDLQHVKQSTAYNAMFDYKKAIPFTETYIMNLYNSGYQYWEDRQRDVCNQIIAGIKQKNEKNFDKDNFNFRGKDYPIFDLWALACERLINTDKYKLMCLENGSISPSGLFFKTSAETTFRYLSDDQTFEEEHTGLGDVIIESQILLKCLKKGKVENGIVYFPFKMLGDTVQFCAKSKKVKPSHIESVIQILLDKSDVPTRATEMKIEQLSAILEEIKSL